MNILFYDESDGIRQQISDQKISPLYWIAATILQSFQSSLKKKMTDDERKN